MRSVGLLGFVLLALVTPALSAPGDLDPTFGVGGVALHDVVAGQHDLGRSVGVQSDGRLIVAVIRGPVIRLLPDGSRDMDFGVGGAAELPPPYDVLYYWRISIEADDGFLLIGGLREGAGGFLARFDADGSIDPSFGDGGVVVFGNVGDIGVYAVRQPDQRIVVAVHPIFEGMALARFSATGELETSFGDGGYATLPISSPYTVRPRLQPDGSIVVAATANVGPGRQNWFAVARVDADGVPDASFGETGIVKLAVPSLPVNIGGTTHWGARASTLVLRSDGSIVAAGSVARGGAGLQWMLVGLRNDGTLDPAFGQGGIAVHPFPGTDLGVITDLVQTPDGKLIAVGQTSAALPQVTVARFNPDGGLDPTFGFDGVVGAGPATGSPAWGEAADAELLDDGRLLVMGYRAPDADADFVAMLARYEMTCPTPEGCTPCTSARYLDDVRMKVGRLGAPIGDETVTLIARGHLAQDANLLANGVRVVVENAADVDLYDVTVPGGAFSAATKAGWKGGAGKFIYRNAGTVVPRPGGIAKITSKVDARGRLTLKVQIKGGSLPIVDGSLPPQTWIALDPPTAESGACVVSPRSMTCEIDATGGKLRCG